MNFNISDVLAKVQEMQSRMAEAQQKLKAIEHTAEVGGGMVSVTVNGKQEVLRIAIEKNVIEQNDTAMLEDLIVSAVNKALEESRVLAREELGKATSGMMPNIPGMDLGNLGL